ncbi:MAG: low molecular weight protein-tyrosine-phosphatase [Chitinophagales bacterium]
MKILMVCLGNICRSPIAEGIMRYKIQEQKLNWEVSSCGTSNWHAGEAPHAGACRIMQKKKMDISHQRAKTFHYSFFEHYDLIYTMDASNYRDVIALAENAEERQKVDMIMNTVEPGRNIPVPDPYYDERIYPVVFEMLEKACSKIIETYKSQEIK